MVATARLVRERSGLIAAALALAVAGLLRLWEPTDDPATSLCVFRRCTGHACPGCGLTRGFAYLIKGDFGKSLFYHPLAPVVAAQVLVGLGFWAAFSIGLWKPRGRFKPERLLLLNAAVLFIVWVVRAVSGTLPPV